ncbi:hypothetical protein ACIQW9_02605 [Herminiimonas sp. NPDC097707]|uniref:hypothetical protein n=1 Tax=Herminiimonas sp. NPDC097707 TaxID=3364007 RepID=UPI00383B005B
MGSIMKDDGRLKTAIIVFICAFLYAIVMMTVSREIVVPRMTSSTTGHIAGDPQYYHELALQKAEDIRVGGYKEFELRPGGNAPGGVASLLYLVSDSSFGIVVLNAILHGASTLIMLMILLCWFPMRISLIAILPLAISPYMMVWFSQINKDSFVLTGVLFFTYGLIRLLQSKETHKPCPNELGSLLPLMSGIFLIWLMRPYVNQILFPVSVFIILFVSVIQLRKGLKIQEFRKLFLCGFFLLIALFFLGKGAASDVTLDRLNTWESSVEMQSHNSVAAECFANIDGQVWHNEEFLPDFIEHKLKAMMGQRCMIFTLLDTQDNATTLFSFVDRDVFPSGSLEALLYLPRAALLGIFSPLPEHWDYIFVYRSSVFYTITPIEAIMFYIGLISMSVWIFIKREWSALVPIVLSFSVMTVYGMATPFIGALYRYRYPWWVMLICLGLAALLHLRQVKKL